ncbi:hypothetical protein [Pseudonocardia sp. WMMC193]|uniref:hypothetical protein n=1 Tax=Pseudonocardia sp. WMMC193 TaxID=2911965 RepID=UPI001F18017C|nr:hypothetical protein [Pseudonocardia sp. WMMC193]MCF7547233.1 hypothetical protein [Pseudonocardia sp. WMMC193]
MAAETDRPRIAGAAGGVGTTTIASALHGEDSRIYRGGAPVEILVCRSTMHSIGNAQRALAAVSHDQPPPVLAVVEDIPGSLSSHVKTRLRMTEGVVTAIVTVPFVADWRSLDDPLTVATELLRPGTDIPRSWRGFVGAMRHLVDEVAPLLSAMRPPAPGRVPIHPTPVPAGRPDRY